LLTLVICAFLHFSLLFQSFVRFTDRFKVLVCFSGFSLLLCFLLHWFSIFIIPFCLLTVCFYSFFLFLFL
jgi:hypothetical protein